MSFAAAACLIMCGALPAFSEPELLVDIDDSPSGHATLVDANADGGLFSVLNKDNTTSVWWITWDGPPFLVVDRVEGVFSTHLGRGFVLFVPDSGGLNVLHLSLDAEPRVDMLTTATRFVRVLESSSSARAWWVTDEGTWSTDGSASGTNLRAPSFTASIEAGGSLYSGSMRWTNDQLIDTALPESSLKRAGTHVVAADGSLFNELGDRLVESTNCITLTGGNLAWVNCMMTDGGVMTYATDGTVSGTHARYGPQGNFVTGELASSDYLLSQADCTVVSAIDGASYRFPHGCRDGRLSGDVFVTENSAISLLPPFEKVDVGPISMFRTAGRKALILSQAGVLLTDGTDAGTRPVPANWPESMITTSSAPRLHSSNGETALYATTRGIWATDGSRKGTFRVGQIAGFWGKSIWAIQDRSRVVFDAAGKSWVPPTGILGPARGHLIGKDGCKAFTIDETHQRHELAIDGCVETVFPRRDGALLTTAEGASFLVRDARAFELGKDFWTAGGIRCGEERCWFLGAPVGGFQAVQTLDLESAAVRTLVNARSVDVASLVVLDASSLGAVVDLGFETKRIAIFADGSQRDLNPGIQWLFASDGRLLLLGFDILEAQSATSLDQLGFPCDPVGISEAGGKIHALCGSVGRSPVLFSGTLDGGFTAVDAGIEPMLPRGDTVAWSTITTEERASLIRATAGGDTREFAGVHGSEFARVREGFVFAGSGSAPDQELWVVRSPASGCGCSADAGAITLLGAALMFRGTRRTRRTQAR